MDSSTRREIDRTLAENTVVLYMKGSREAPQCGFSAKVVEILDQFLPDYFTVDVLAHPALREGIKEHSSWPTIPQLYVRGEFVGGSDIVAAIHESGELSEKLGELARPPKPKITLSDAARVELEAALEGAAECVRLDVSPAFEHDLAVGVPDPRDIVVDVAGLRISVTPAAARRADGIAIDIVSTPEGPAFKIHNPNQPARVKPISATELKALLERREDLVLVDVRTEGERAIAKIEGARIYDAALRQELESGPRTRTIVCQCHHGVRSLRAAEELVRDGFSDVHNLVGGIDAWSMDVDPDVARY